jgi:hypothetical protein
MATMARICSQRCALHMQRWVVLEVCASKTRPTNCGDYGAVFTVALLLSVPGDESEPDMDAVESAYETVCDARDIHSKKTLDDSGACDPPSTHNTFPTSHLTPSSSSCMSPYLPVCRRNRNGRRRNADHPAHPEEELGGD